MSRTVWINGAFCAEGDASVSIFDRGLLFADAVYEGLGVLDGRIIDFSHHMARLRRSLGELDIAEPMDEATFKVMLDALILHNDLEEGFLYLHVTRGVHDRDYLYPDGLEPTVFAFSQPQHHGRADDPPKPVRLASAPDLRWARRDIKTSNLLGQVLAKKVAQENGADEALMVDADGYITEGGAVSFFIVGDGRIFARPLGQDLLPGITRQTMLRVAEQQRVEIVAERYRIEDVYGAEEAFVTGASSYIQPVSHVDNRRIGNGGTGELTRLLRTEYLKAVRLSFD